MTDDEQGNRERCDLRDKAQTHRNITNLDAYLTVVTRHRLEGRITADGFASRLKWVQAQKQELTHG